jgi:hypothetical protein
MMVMVDSASRPLSGREAAVPNEKSVLVVGLDPALIDFSKPGYAPGMTTEKVFAGLKSSEGELTRLGYSVRICLIDFGETAEAVLESELQERSWDCIMIGAGLRTNPDNFLLFEKVINVAHQYGPRAKLCFNTVPGDTPEAVKRWL